MPSNTQIFRKIQSAAAGTDNRHGRRREAWRQTRLRRADDRHRAEQAAWAARLMAEMENATPTAGKSWGTPEAPAPMPEAPEMHGSFDGIITVDTADGSQVTFSLSSEPPAATPTVSESMFEDDDQNWRVVAGLSSGPPPPADLAPNGRPESAIDSCGRAFCLRGGRR